jgi:hypothetical protein
MSESAGSPREAGYFDPYGLTSDETAVLNLVYGPARLSAEDAADQLGWPEERVRLTLRAAGTDRSRVPVIANL